MAPESYASPSPGLALTAPQSTWLIAGVLALGAAWFLDELLGETAVAAFTGAPPDGAHVALRYLANIGLPPVVAVVSLVTGLVLLRSGRKSAGAAVLTASIAVIAFSARVFAIADSIGWREAAAHALISGRTVATTAIAIVVAVVLYREGLIRRRNAFLIGIGFPLAIGFTRMTLGVHSTWIVIGQWLIGGLIAAVTMAAHRVVTATSTDDVDWLRRRVNGSQ